MDIHGIWEVGDRQGIIQKKYGRISSWQNQKRLKLGGLGGPGRCLGEPVGANPLNNFAFFLIKHAKKVIVRVNVG